jgi:hypothetical protein
VAGRLTLLDDRDIPFEVLQEGEEPAKTGRSALEALRLIAEEQVSAVSAVQRLTKHVGQVHRAIVEAYSSLVDEFPFELLKIVKTVIQGLRHSPAS